MQLTDFGFILVHIKALYLPNFIFVKNILDQTKSLIATERLPIATRALSFPT